MFWKQLLAGLGQSVKKMGEAEDWTVVSCCHLQGHGRKGVRDIMYGVQWAQRREGTGLKIINPKLSEMCRYSKEGLHSGASS